MKFILVLILLRFSYAADRPIFFENIKEKPVQVQKDLLERRIKLDSRPEFALTSKLNIEEYLKISEADSAAYDFLFKIGKNSSDIEFKKNLLEVLADPAFLEQTILQIEKIGNSLFTKELSTKFYKNIIRELVEQNKIDHYIKFRDEIIQMINYLMEDVSKNADENSFILSYRLGLTELTKMIRGEIIGMINSSSRLKFINCYSYLNEKNMKESKDCFSRVSGFWSMLGDLYVEQMKGIKLETMKAKFAKFRRTFNDSVILKDPRVYAYEYLLTQDIASNLQKNLKNKNPNYKYDFILLMLDKRLGKLEKEISDQIEDKFYSSYPDTYLSKVLKGDIQFEKLKEWFGENSMFYQSAIIKKNTE